jgi:hypothetical protein
MEFFCIGFCDKKLAAVPPVTINILLLRKNPSDLRNTTLVPLEANMASLLLPV